MAKAIPPNLFVSGAVLLSVGAAGRQFTGQILNVPDNFFVTATFLSRT